MPEQGDGPCLMGTEHSPTQVTEHQFDGSEIIKTICGVCGAEC